MHVVDLIPPNAEAVAVVAALQVYGPLVHFNRHRSQTAAYCDWKRPEDAARARNAVIRVQGKILQVSQPIRSCTKHPQRPPRVPAELQEAANA